MATAAVTAARSHSDGLDATSLAMDALGGGRSWQGVDGLPHPTRKEEMTATLADVCW